MPSAGPEGVVGAILVIAIFVVIAYVLIVLLARGLHRVMPATLPPRDPALDALRLRFARGEIDEEEFQRLRAVLRQD